MSRSVSVAAPSRWKDQVERTLSTLLGPSWHSLDRLRVNWLSREEYRDNAFVQALVDSHKGTDFLGDVLLLGDANYSGNPLPTPLISVRRFASIRDFQTNFEHVLRANELDFSSRYEAMLRPKWESAPISRASIEQWLQQFEALGQFRWIGEALLSALDSRSTSDMLNQLGLESLPPGAHICYYSPELDPLGSGIPLAYSASKRAKSQSAIRLTASKEDLDPLERVLLEDCALSGTEFTEMADEIWPDVANYGNLDRHDRVSLRYAVVTNAAEVVIKKKINSKNLVNVRLDTRYSSRLETLTPQGLLALENDKFYCPVRGVALKPSQHIRLALFDRTELWGSRDRSVAAKRLLKKIGAQLYEQDYLQRKGSTAKKCPEWIRESGLGAGGLALTLTLARTVPKSSLPVLWAKGEVKLGHRVVEWEPLFRQG